MTEKSTATIKLKETKDYGRSKLLLKSFFVLRLVVLGFLFVCFLLHDMFPFVEG